MNSSNCYININYTVYITCQLIGTNMFLHGGCHVFVQVQTTLPRCVDPRLSEWMKAWRRDIIIFWQCFARKLPQTLPTTCVALMMLFFFSSSSEQSSWYVWRTFGSQRKRLLSGVTAGLSLSSWISCLLFFLNNKTKIICPATSWRFEVFIKMHKSAQRKQSGDSIINTVCLHACFGAHVRWFVMMRQTWMFSLHNNWCRNNLFAVNLSAKVHLSGSPWPCQMHLQLYDQQTVTVQTVYHFSSFIGYRET